MAQSPHIQWFPGHMAKTRRLIGESISQVDCVAEVLDARIPQSSRNPVLDELCGAKPRVLLLNKSDLADEEATRRWLRYYRGRGAQAIALDCKSGRGVSAFLPLLQRLLREKIERAKNKGMRRCTLRVMVAGIPNVGKSAFINRVAGAKRAKTEDRPGVTRSKQWISIGSGVELMDTPGILWPKFEDPASAERLAFTGAVKDDVVDTAALAARLCEELAGPYGDALRSRFHIKEELSAGGEELLALAAAGRGMRVSGGGVDLERAASVLLDEFRGGKLGRITLELPPEAPVSGPEEEPEK